MSIQLKIWKMHLKISKAELCLINLDLYLVDFTESNANMSIPRKLYTAVFTVNKKIKSMLGITAKFDF